MSSLVAADLHSGGAGLQPHGASGELETGNGDAAGSAAAAVAAAAAAAAAAGNVAGGVAAGLQSRSSHAGGSGSIGDQRLIVCIDDDDVNQVVLQGMLSSQHYRYVRVSLGCRCGSGGRPSMDSGSDPGHGRIDFSA
jgi:hypothetical protein